MRLELVVLGADVSLFSDVGGRHFVRLGRPDGKRNSIASTRSSDQSSLAWLIGNHRRRPETSLDASVVAGAGLMKCMSWSAISIINASDGSPDPFSRLFKRW